jgi:hypothetical protein
MVTNFLFTLPKAFRTSAALLDNQHIFDGVPATIRSSSIIDSVVMSYLINELAISYS